MHDASRRRVADSELPDYALIARALAAARGELVAERWHKGAWSVDANGRETEPHDRASVAWCVQGVVLRHLLEGTNLTIRAATHLLHRTASRLSDGRYTSLFAFNDAPCTIVTDTHRLLDTAAAEAARLAALPGDGSVAIDVLAPLTLIKVGAGSKA
jgi:hypothetical protein